MSRRLFHVESIRDGAARVEGDTAKHLRKVLRAEIGQKYEISDGRSLHLAEISGFGKQLVEFRVLEEIVPLPLPARVRLFAALIKFDHFEWMVEKATEIGADRITPVAAFRTSHGLDRAAAKRLDRWKRIAAEAAQQSRRLAPPLVDPPVDFDQAVSHRAACRLFLDEQRGAPPILQHLAPGLSEAALLAGPEGGWDDRERQAARQAGWLAVSLGPRVLRAETAGIVALGIVMAAASSAGA